jgi:hypothetical protein
MTPDISYQVVTCYFRLVFKTLGRAASAREVSAAVDGVATDGPVLFDVGGSFFNH